jgi:hypothetical protein
MVVISKGFPRVYQKIKLFKGISAMNRNKMPKRKQYNR